MRLLADENFPLPAIEAGIGAGSAGGSTAGGALRRVGHDVTWARTDTPGVVDAVLPGILLTLDKDFWQLAVQRRQPLQRSGVILFRVHPAVPDNVIPLVLRTIATNAEWVGDAAVVTTDRVLMVRVTERK